MKLSLLTVLGVAVALSHGAPSSNPIVPYIVNGTPAIDGQVPYVASLQRSASHTCGAVILSDQWLLTVAHCVIGTTPSSLTVRYNSLRYGSGGQIASIAEVITHEQYSSASMANDIALLRTATPLSLGGMNAQAVKLPADGASVPSETPATVAGWGTTAEGTSQLSPVLLVATKPVISNVECAQAYPGGMLTDGMLCVGHPGDALMHALRATTFAQVRACLGDSGAPASGPDGTLYGLATWGQGCGRPQYPGVYTRVPSYVGWVRAKTGL